jgi:alkylated DNA repair dioxygenase AlkB
MYTPTVHGGRKMSVGMLCLGKHWNGLTYTSEDRRSDYDGLAVPAIPPSFAQIARRAAADAGFTMQPDLCIMNSYSPDAKLGVLQDKDERAETIAAAFRSCLSRWAIRLGSSSAARPGVTLRSRCFSGQRCAGHGRAITSALPRCHTHPARHRARGNGPGRFNLTFRQW